MPRRKSKNEERRSNKENQRENIKKGYAVGKWLQNDVKLPQYVEAFIKNGYDDMDTVEMTLKKRDLHKIGITTRGHRKKIMMFVNRLKAQRLSPLKKEFMEHCIGEEARKYGY